MRDDPIVEELHQIRREQFQEGLAGWMQLVEVDVIGVSDLAGSLKDDPFLDDIVNEAYRLRDMETVE